MRIKYKIKIAYFNNEIIKQINPIKNNQFDKEIIHWFNSGNKYLSEIYENGKMNGKYREYFDNNKLRIECSYVDSKLNGEYKRYGITGKCSRKRYFDNGQRIK